MAFDVSALETTSSKRAFPWRSTRLGLLLVRANGRIEQAGTLAAKRELVAGVAPGDCLLAVRMLQYSPVMLYVDDIDEVRAALKD